MNLRVTLVLLAGLAAATTTPAADTAVLDAKTTKYAQKVLARSDKVIIAGFRVAFNLEDSASASTDSRLKNLGNSIGSGPKTVHSDASVSMKVTLGGVQPADFQAITEAAYADFKARLEKSGRTVVPVAALKASKGWSELKFAGATPGKPWVNDKGTRAYAVCAPAELPLFFGHFDTNGIGDFSMDLGNWRAINQLSVEHKAVVLVPTLVVNFVKMTSSGRNKMLRNDAEVGADPVIHLLPQLTTTHVFHAKIRLAGDGGVLQLGDEVAAPGGFGVLRQVSASDNAALNSALVQLTGLAGRVNAKSAQVLAAVPADYRRLSLEAGASYHAAVGAVLAAK